MSLNFKLNENDLPTRPYPPNKVKNGKRYILRYGEHFSFPASYPYNQYLTGVLLPIALGLEFVTSNSSSVFRKLHIKSIKRSMLAQSNQPYRATNFDVYVSLVASDIETLYLKDKLPVNLRRDLLSTNNDAMRGAFYEIAVAASFVRAGYEVEWLTGHKKPEFIALRGNNIHVEAKRRNSYSNEDKNIAKEVRAIRQLLNKALKKDYKKPYLIYIDSDFAPKSSAENSALYSSLEKELNGKIPDGVALVITNMGYEHESDIHESGNNSAMVMKGSDETPKSEIDNLVKHFYAQLPPAVSDDWRI